MPQAEPPRSPWSSTADPDEMLSIYSDTLDDDVLNSTMNDSREPRVSFDSNDIIGRCLFGHLTPNNDLEQEEGRFDGDTTEWDRDGGRSELSLNAPKMRNQFARSAQARGKSVETLEQFRGPARPERHSHTPSIVVSHSTNDEIGDRIPPSLSESRSSTSSPTSPEGTDGFAGRRSFRPMVPIPRDTRPRGLSGTPNNYELATQDRLSVNITNEIEPQFGTSVVDSMRAFNVDADSTATDAAVVGDCPNTKLLHVKRPRLSTDYPGFQTLANENRRSKPWPKQPANPPRVSAAQRSSQTPAYPTPRSSSEDSSSYQHCHSVCSREIKPSVQTALSCNDPNEPLSPASLLSTTSFETDDNIARCLECPDAIYRGRYRKTNLQRHQRDHHNDRSRLKCVVPDCLETFTPGRRDNLLRHVETQHPGYPSPALTTKRKRKSGSE